MNTLRTFAKRIPIVVGTVRLFRCILNWCVEGAILSLFIPLYWLRYRDLLPRLYPVQTDKPLIRFGPHGDGGYIIPDDLEGISACFSPGVSTISGFEQDCADRGMKVYLADASVEAPAESHDLFEFSKVFIGGRNTGDYITLERWVEQSSEDTTSEFMMQMDIEGFEYEALAPVSAELMKRFRIIVIEFHELEWMSKDKYEVFNKLLETHVCIHTHPNNNTKAIQFFNLKIPPIVELTFLRKDRVVENALYRRDFPHPLDSNNIANPTLPLPACWFSQK